MRVKVKNNCQLLRNQNKQKFLQHYQYHEFHMMSLEQNKRENCELTVYEYFCIICPPHDYSEGKFFPWLFRRKIWYPVECHWRVKTSCIFIGFIYNLCAMRSPLLESGNPGNSTLLKYPPENANKVINHFHRHPLGIVVNVKFSSHHGGHWSIDPADFESSRP